jgi:hypothetical protein
MPSYTKHIQTYYTPANIDQYKESLENFEWNLFLTDNYYPSLDSIHRFLYNLTINGREWEDLYDQISNQKINEYHKKVVQNKKKVTQNKEKLKKEKTGKNK